MLLNLGFKIGLLGAEGYSRQRAFFIEEKIILKNIPKDTNNLRIWIPYPVNDGLQAVRDVKLNSPMKATFVEDEKNQNKILYLSLTQPLYKNEMEIGLLFKVNRKEAHPFCELAAPQKRLSHFLKADRLIPVTGQIKSLAQEITKDKVTDLEKARAVYDYIIDELVYSKDDPNVCGVGNSLLTLKAKKGICTDYHSLFISLVRSLGIPAKFEIGFHIPEDKKEGLLNGYHCWAKFYLKGKGWIPVDISEADRHPARRGYFFGHIDENRVHLTTGRDINLKYAKARQPLNFFVYPYVEVNGKLYKDANIEIMYKDLEGGA